LLGSALAPRLMKQPWSRVLAAAFAGATLGLGGLALAGFLHGSVAFALSFAANLLLDGSVALAFIIAGTVSVQITPREVRGRVFALNNLYSAAVRGGSLVLAGALAATGNPFPAFVAIALGFIVALSAALHAEASTQVNGTS
jgi:hypothetical protein